MIQRDVTTQCKCSGVSLQAEAEAGSGQTFRLILDAVSSKRGIASGRERLSWILIGAEEASAFSGTHYRKRSTVSRGPNDKEKTLMNTLLECLHDAQQFRLVPFADDDCETKRLARLEMAERNGADRIADLIRSKKGKLMSETKVSRLR